MDTPATLGAIFYNSIGQNQSHEVMRWLMRPTSDNTVAVPSANVTDFNRVSSDLGAAIAYAMAYAYQNTTNETEIIGPPQGTGIVLRSGIDPLVSVKPSATDVFYVAASALMGVVFSGCDANWRCHVLDCNTPEDIVQKRAGACCSSVSPMLQLHLSGTDYLIDDAVPAYVQAQNPTVLEFLSRCNRVDFGDTSQLGMSACNTNASSNYMGSTVLLDVNSNTPGAPPVASALDCCLACMGNAQCNVWVYCGSEYVCSGCNGRALNYRAGAGSGGQTFGPYARGCYYTSALGTVFPTGTCTLKSADFKTIPQADSSSGSQDFTSGYLTPHSAF
ncbi:g689 [Coccomyxa viridis]|uniref:G689 protein n=1 Tax=Coccomyxa viridis TaxID=1274662 RepID=A0ABP1FIC1_9CHLO